jgi:hypothetical protein
MAKRYIVSLNLSAGTRKAGRPAHKEIAVFADSAPDAGRIAEEHNRGTGFTYRCRVVRKA